MQRQQKQQARLRLSSERRAAGSGQRAASGRQRASARLRLWLLTLGLFFAGCSGDGSSGTTSSRFNRTLTVVVTEAPVFERPDSLSRKVSMLRFGQQVQARESRSLGTPEGWEELQLGADAKAAYGFARASTLGSAELLGRLRSLMQSVEGIEPQASGVTTAATFLRLEPGRDGATIEKLASGIRFEMFERQATLKEPPAPDPAAPTPAATAPPTALPRRGAKTPTPVPARKEIWYKIRVADGRVGWVYTSNVKFEPPIDIEEYTRFRRAVAWQKLRMVETPLGNVNEYLVAYGTPGIDFGADFNRIEIYAWDGHRFQTPFAKGNLLGILPIRVSRQGQDVSIELSELDPKVPGQLIVRTYRFPSPIKEVKRETVKADVGLH